jgi:hypothetical protein
MANEQHLELLMQGSDAWNSWRTNNPSERPDLTGADLYGTYLPEANLSEADLSEANLNVAQLYGANLEQANLQRVSLRNAELSRANLQEANLSEATLTYASLKWANLGRTDLSRANLNAASLFRANLSEADLQYANLFAANLSEADFRGASLTLEQLQEANTAQGVIRPDGWKQNWGQDWRDSGITDAINSPDTESQSASPLRDFAETLAAYIGIPAILLYPVGFLVFVLQISSFYPFDFSTAWYATSLIPATVVTGQGAKYLLVPLLISVIISTLVAHQLVAKYGKALSEAFKPKQAKEEEASSEQRSPLRRFITRRRHVSALLTELSVLRRQRLVPGISVIMTLVLIVALLIAPLVGLLVAFATGRPGFLYWGFLVPLGTVSGLIGAGLIAFSYYERTGSEGTEVTSGSARSSVSWLWRGATERWIFKGLLVAYAGSVLSALLIILPLDRLGQDPDLPHVKMQVSGHEIEDGVLLSHSDGYWHVIDTLRTDRDASASNQSFVIRSGKDVSDVRIYESPLQKADLDVSVVDDSRWVNMDLGYAWVNEHLEYDVRVDNSGPQQATDVKLTINPSPLFRVYATVGGQSCTNDENPIICDLGRLSKDGTKGGVHLEVTPKEEISFKVGGKLKKAPRRIATFDAKSREVDPDPSDVVKETVDVWVKATKEGADAYRPKEWTKRKVRVKVLNRKNTDDSGLQEITYSAPGSQGPQTTLVDKGETNLLLRKEGTTSLIFHGKNDAGNDTEETFKIRLDKTAPKKTRISPSSPDGPTNNNMVVITFSGEDEFPKDSELDFLYRLGKAEPWEKAPGTSVTFGGPTGLTDGEYTFFVKAVDQAGNKDEDPAEQSFTVDTTEPELKPLSTIVKEATSEDGRRVTYDATATDEVGRDPQVSCVKGAPPTAVESDDIFPLGTTTVTCTATDAARNESTDTFDITVRDTRRPHISIEIPPEGAEYNLKKYVRAVYSCDDDGSGTKSCVGPVPSGDAINTAWGGPRKFQVEAVDRVGKTATKSHTYIVAYDFRGFLLPLKARPKLNTIRAGDPVLVQFDLKGGRDEEIYAKGYPRSVKIECDSQSRTNPIERSSRHHPGDHYDYVWDTDGSWSDTCRRLIFGLDDGSMYSLDFKLT